ncbi:MAG: hypothetical protein U5K72_12630 [Balneolaceae bacterium]|nr:hypothetical protein [Balneolaceae bacterium]
MKSVFNRLFLLLFTSVTIFVVNVEVACSQTMTVGDPMFQYLRLLETENDSAQLPSLMLRSVSAEDYLQKLELKETHPWSTHPFFGKDVEFIEIIEEVTTQDSVQTHQGETGRNGLQN